MLEAARRSELLQRRTLPSAQRATAARILGWSTKLLRECRWRVSTRTDRREISLTASLMSGKESCYALRVAVPISYLYNLLLVLLPVSPPQVVGNMSGGLSIHNHTIVPVSNIPHLGERN